LVWSDGGTILPTRADPALVEALARAFRYRKLLDEERCASISEMAAAERIERVDPRLAPAADPARAGNRQGSSQRMPANAVTLPRLVERFPLDWLNQRAALEGESRS
jgi:hypothetical protein